MTEYGCAYCPSDTPIPWFKTQRGLNQHMDKKHPGHKMPGYSLQHLYKGILKKL